MNEPISELSHANLSTPLGYFYHCAQLLSKCTVYDNSSPTRIQYPELVVACKVGASVLTSRVAVGWKRAGWGGGG